MWNVAMLTIMLSLVGYYSMIDQRVVPNAQDAVARNLAGSMGTYRQAVIDYCTAYFLTYGVSVPTGLIENSALTLPTGYTTELASRWKNYIDGSGTIYIFPSTTLPVNITGEVVRLSQNSVLAGEAGSDGTLHAPADLATPISYVPPSTPTQDIPLAPDYHPTTRIPLPAVAVGITPAIKWIAYETYSARHYPHRDTRRLGYWFHDAGRPHGHDRYGDGRHERSTGGALSVAGRCGDFKISQQIG